MSEQSGVSFTTNILEQAGLDPGTISLLIQGSEKMREAQEKVKRLGGVVSKQDTENAQRFSTALHDVGTISEGLGRTIWTNLSPAISEIIEKVIKWYEANGEWLRSEIAEKVKMLADYLRSIDWNAIGTGIKEFAVGANDAAKAVGGWKVVFEALLGAWLFTKLLALLRMLGLIRLAITGSATPGIFGSLVGALGVGGTAAVGAAVGTAVGADVAVPNAAKPGVTNHWDDEASGAAGGAGMGSVLRRGGRWLKRKLGFGGGSDAGPGAGSGEGSRSFRNNNPGNIKYGPFAQRMGATGADSAGFARFPGGGGGRQVAGSIQPNNGAGGVDQQQGGATHRKQPITDVLAKQISDAAASAGVNAEVFSGGQSESGPDHYGSHRHDHGRSADLRLYNVGQDGKRRYLNMTNDADRVVMEKFIRESVKNGANGVGASPTYMGPLGIHVGGGSPAAWGAGGSAANAPEWVRRAHQQGMEDRLVAAAQAAKTAKPAAPAPKPEAAFDAARRAGAMASVASANAASATVASRVSNDNRNTDNRRYDETHLHNVSVYPATGTQSSIMAELKQAARGGKAFAAEADYGKA
ncbi:hypothetical protein [Methylobacterium radiotolerans]|uniref:hypothetical protein n=1 Tax=Methylobacterium radiotolerans TaxID=31998 RepID=UPI001F3A7FC9|nr:hypothetical protein [Methylobacterium radiotolerans]UIY45748.1 hypothetical protein LZ599_32140 [Methylobacterium radiotolerans]